MMLVVIAAEAMVACGAEEKYVGEVKFPKLDVLAADLKDFIFCKEQ